MTDAKKRAWLDVMRPNINRFEVAADFGGTACWNAEGSKAMASLLRKMCAIIDEEIDHRNFQKDTHSSEPKTFTIKNGDGPQDKTSDGWTTD